MPNRRSSTCTIFHDSPCWLCSPAGGQLNSDCMQDEVATVSLTNGSCIHDVASEVQVQDIEASLTAICVPLHVIFDPKHLLYMHPEL